jgi:thiosulfate dehydrogenase [quinone] large subunit
MIVLRGERVNAPNNVNSVWQRDRGIAYLMLRATLGLNIFIHGASRIVLGLSGFAGSLVPLFQKTFLPAWSVYTFGLTLPWAEALIGLLLFAGLRTRAALITGSLLMLMLTFGTALRQDWQTAYLQLMYAVVYAALLAGRQNNLYSIDAVMERHRPGH